MIAGSVHTSQLARTACAHRSQQQLVPSTRSCVQPNRQIGSNQDASLMPASGTACQLYKLVQNVKRVQDPVQALRSQRSEALQMNQRKSVFQVTARSHNSCKRCMSQTELKQASVAYSCVSACPSKKLWFELLHCSLCTARAQTQRAPLLRTSMPSVRKAKARALRLIAGRCQTAQLQLTNAQPHIARTMLCWTQRKQLGAIRNAAPCTSRPVERAVTATVNTFRLLAKPLTGASNRSTSKV